MMMHLAGLGVYNKSLAEIMMSIPSPTAKVTYIGNSPMKISLEKHPEESRLLSKLSSAKLS